MSAMCGICGILIFEGNDYIVREDEFLSMTDALKHRGPDCRRIWISENKKVGLGHTRLKIIDLSDAGNQPLRNEEGDLFLTCNGEIYNFLDLRGKLLKKGHHFTSKTDSEVILHCYEEMGLDCISELDGMFAFGIWDARKGELVLVRDRLGKKPIYYTIQNGKLIFASEIKALLRLPDINKKLNRRAVYDYFTFSYVPAPNTMFKGIYKLPAAHFLKVCKDGDYLVNRYWHPEANAFNKSTSDEEILENVEKILLKAINKRFISDVPVGIFLSGGLDSSLITTMSDGFSHGRLNTFTIGYEEHIDGSGDFHFARQLAKSLKTNHIEIVISKNEVIKSLDKVINQYDDLVNESLLPFYFLARTANEHGFKVILIGEGSDEVFSGYRFLQTVWKYEKILRYLKKFPHLLQEILFNSVKPLLLWTNHNFPVEIMRSVLNREETFWGMDVLFRYDKKNRLFTDEFLEDVDIKSNSYDLIKSYYEDFEQLYNEDMKGNNIFSRWCYLELNNHLPDAILSRVDKGSMQFSVECRAPFLDILLVNTSIGLRDGLKCRDGHSKYIVKKIAERYLPPSLIYRKKTHLQVPFTKWIQEGIPDLPTSLELVVKKNKIFRKDFVDELYSRSLNGESYYSEKIWAIYLFSRWLETWFT